jgi:large subunit ribosomal protein L33
MAVGHIVVPALLVTEIIWHPSIWFHLVVWLPLTCLLTFDLLPRFKGLIIGLQWALRMHGFGGHGTDVEKAI